MKIAVPLSEGKCAAHFGHCESFALMKVDSSGQNVIGRVYLEPPAHQPGVLPPWLAEQGVDVVIAGGMGVRAQQLFKNEGIRVIVGAPSEIPERLAEEYLAGTLSVGKNVCAH